MNTRLEFSSYRFGGRDEFCLKAGTEHHIQILLIPPLFDEMNRMRRVLADVMRLLVAKGIGSILPDLPGTNESLFPGQDANLDIWRDALTVCQSTNPVAEYVASFRGGCLIDLIPSVKAHWRLSPVKGNTLLRTMMRTRIASDKEAGVVTTMAELTKIADAGPIELAGNIIGSSMFRQLQEAKFETPAGMRTARLKADSQPSDIKLPGSPLWLRAEPDSDQELSRSVADDLAQWVRA